MTKRILCFVLLCSVLLCSGCWDIREGETQAFVLAVGMDAMGEKDHRYIFEVASPQAMYGQESGTDKTVNVTVTARTMEEAMVLAQRKIGREMNVEHLEIVVITQKLAERGFGGLLDYLFSSHAMRRSLKIAVLDEKCDLETLMNMNPVQSPSLADTMQRLLTENLGSSGKRYDAGSILEMILNSVEEERLDYVISRIGYDEREGMITLWGGTVLRDGLAVQNIDVQQLNALYWLRSEDTVPHITVTVGEDQQEFQVEQQSADIKTAIVNGEPRVTIQIQAVCQMVETEILSERDQEAEVLLQEAAAAVREKMLQDCGKMIENSQKWDVDMLNLSGQFRTRQHRWWRENGDRFYEIYKDIPIEVQAEINVRRAGNVT